MSELTEKISEQLERAEQSRLNNLIAVAVAISASLMAIFNIKDNNIVQAMSQAQAHAIDAWSYFQAKSTKQSLVENQLNQLELQRIVNAKAAPDVVAKIEAQAQAARQKVERYEEEKTQIKAQAEGFQKEYDELNVHDDQFDLAEALISLGLSILGITALTQKKPLFVFATVLSIIGVIFGLAGFLGWSIHPEWIMKILG